MAVLISVALLTGGVSETGFAQPVTEQEPNDSKQTATSLDAGQILSGSVSSATDRDWYAFEAVEGMAATLTLENRALVDYDLHDADGRSLRDVPADFSFESSGDANVGSFAVPRTGTYYLLITSHQGSTPTYTVEIAGTHPPNEPNDDHESSTVLADGDSVDGEITSANDEDWYAFEAVKGANVTLTFVVDGYVHYELLDDNHRSLLEEPVRFSLVSDDNETYVGRFVAPESGTYYFVVIPSGEIAATYTIEVGGNRPVNEPNDDFGNSTWLSPGTVLNGEIASDADVDYYAFEASEGDTVSIALDNDKPILYGIRDPSDSPIDLTFDGTVGQFVAPETGAYHFWVRSDGGSLPNYSLGVVSERVEEPVASTVADTATLSDLTDTQILVAVIGATATIAAALLTAVASRRS
ncbi:hypothetical protein [Haloprofundus salinisoli]|uniref:hypothetical protein n=1 Tax=Haloprofundus salinisoli TaxID=2876193 RepID=UPI001CCA55F9|nr:hypothetical protein [Haloprofundus salinisoli]